MNSSDLDNDLLSPSEDANDLSESELSPDSTSSRFSVAELDDARRNLHNPDLSAEERKEYRNRLEQAISEDGLHIVGEPIPIQAGSSSTYQVTLSNGLKAFWKPDDDPLFPYTEPKAGELGYYPVVDTIVHHNRPLLRATILFNQREDTVLVTGEHPFFTLHERLTPKNELLNRGRWTAAKNLRPDDRLVNTQGDVIEVVSLESLPQRDTVYNLTVASAHTYFVGEEGVWVHNLCTAEMEYARNNLYNPEISSNERNELRTRFPSERDTRHQ